MTRKRIWWYSLNIYPTTKRGQFTVVLLKRYGFRWDCKRHEKTECKDCTRFGKNEMCAVWRSEPIDSEDVYDILSTALEAVRGEPDNRHPREARLAPLPPAP